MTRALEMSLGISVIMVILSGMVLTLLAMTPPDLAAAVPPEFQSLPFPALR